MTEIEKTAYPRFSKYKVVSSKELKNLYTPSSEEILLAEKYTKDLQNKCRFLILLKSFQQLGYFVSIEKVPQQIKQHIAICLQLTEAKIELNYSHSKTFHSHKQVIRQLLDVKAFDKQALELANNIGQECAYRINNIPDLINNIIERLIYKRYELPAFGTLDKIASNCRVTVNNILFKKICDNLPEDIKNSLENLTKITTNNKSGYNEIKELPKKPTFNNLANFIAHHNWLLSFGVIKKYLPPELTKSKIKEIVNEAKVVDVDGLKDFTANKRLSFIACLLYDAQITGIDNLTKMLCKIVNQAHKQAKRKLEKLRLNSKWKIIDIVELLSEMIEIIENKEQKLSAEKLLNTLQEKISNKGNIQELKDLCAQMIAFAKQDYLFLVSQFMSKKTRNACFNVLSKLKLEAAIGSKAAIKATIFMLEHANSKELKLNIGELDLSFMSAAWQKIIFVKGQKQEVIKEHFEAGLLSALVNELRAGDLIVKNSEFFSGYKSQLLTKEECATQVKDYCDTVKISAEGKVGVQLLKEQLAAAINAFDNNYPNIKDLTIDQGIPILTPPKAKQNSSKTAWLKNQIIARIKEKHILEVLCSTHHYTGWANQFGHISGSASKIYNMIEKYILTVFAYGTSMGPTQTVKHFQQTFQVTPHMLSLINIRHITTKLLDQAIEVLVNKLNQFQVLLCWGDGKSCATDGSLVSIYGNNLFAEYHLRYGARGAISYKHVANNYIAFFVSLIPCGVWEVIAILEGLLQNKSEVQPNKISGDTQEQSSVAFALTYLLGVKLMPRIRNWQEYIMFKPEQATEYKHVGALFTKVINWTLIEECWEEFLQIALSIKHGKISTKLLLQQLTNYARKNKLLRGLQELGYVVRTLFLIEYVSDPELRREINADTNKVENFHQFSSWFNIGNKGYIVASNDPYQQEKVVKYNLLIANAVMLNSVIGITNVILELQQEGHIITPEDVAGISPYIIDPYKRFGDLAMNYNAAAQLILTGQPQNVWQNFDNKL